MSRIHAPKSFATLTVETLLLVQVRFSNLVSALFLAERMHPLSRGQSQKNNKNTNHNVTPGNDKTPKNDTGEKRDEKSKVGLFWSDFYRQKIPLTYFTCFPYSNQYADQQLNPITIYRYKQCRTCEKCKPKYMASRESGCCVSHGTAVYNLQLSVVEIFIERFRMISQNNTGGNDG